MANVYGIVGPYIEDSSDYIVAGYFNEAHGSASITVSGTILLDAGQLAYALEDGTDYTWANTVPANSYTWDTWPDNVWGEFSGLHIPVVSSTTTNAGIRYDQPINITLATVNVIAGTRTRSGESTIGITASVSSSADRQRGGSASATIATTGSATPTRQRSGDSTLDVTTSVTATSTRQRSATVTADITTSLTTQGNVVYTTPVSSTITTSVAVTGNAVLDGAITITLGTVNTTVGRIFRPDPYRTGDIISETRTIPVLDDDNRQRVALSETRTIVVLDDDNRKYTLESETRQYKLPIPPLVNKIRTNQ